MESYKYLVNWAGNIFEGEFEASNNEDAKRELRKLTKNLGIPTGKYFFVNLMKEPEHKILLSEDMWVL